MTAPLLTVESASPVTISSLLYSARQNSLQNIQSGAELGQAQLELGLVCLPQE